MASSTPPSSSSSSLLKNKTNYTRLCRLIIDIGSRVLRGVLDAQLHPPADLHRHLNSPAVNNTLKTLRRNRVLNTQQWNKLYPPAPGAPSSANFDITLLFLLLRNTCGLTPPTTGWDAAPLPADLSKQADLIRVKRCRNEITAHSSVMELSDVDFKNHWTEIEAALIRLGGSQYGPDIYRLKIESMDPENTAFLNILLQSWEESEYKKMDVINEKLDELKTEQSAFIKEHQEREAQTKFEQLKPFCILPQKPSHDTTIRHEEVSTTLDEIYRKRTTHPNHITITYLSGNPGCGKSELARQIGEKTFDEFDKKISSKFVATLNASNLETLSQSYIELGCQLQCNEESMTMTSENNSREEKLRQLQAHIIPKVQNYSFWLLIVDNVEDMKVVSKFIPHSGQKLLNGKGHILITTQDSTCIPRSDSHSHHIQLKLGMKLDDAIKTLRTISGFLCSETIAKKVCKQLDYQPLALACAAVYMQHVLYTDPTMNWERYLEEIEIGNFNYVDELFEDTNLTYPKTMTTAVKMAVEKISEKSKIMQHTFEVMAVIAPEFISLSHVISYVLDCMPGSNKNTIAAAITSSSLIVTSRDESKRLSVRVHQVVYHVLQSVYQATFSRSADELSFFRKFVKVFSYIGNIKKASIELIQNTAPLIQHFAYFSEKVKHFFERHNILKAVSVGNAYGVHYQSNVSSTQQYTPLAMFLMNVVSKVCEKHGKYVTARSLLEISYCIIENCHEDHDHKRLGQVLYALGVVLYRSFAYQEAKECLLKALSIKKQIYGSNHPTMVTSLSLLGIVFLRLNKLDEAKECYGKALIIEENDPAVLHNLGMLLIELEDYEKAQECLERAISINEGIHGSNHLYIARSLDGLARILHLTGELNEARAKFDEALSIEESIYGRNHPQSALTLYHLGTVLEKLGKLDEAKECFEKDLAIQESTYGSNHPNVNDTLSSLESVLNKLGKLDKAKGIYQKALAIDESAYNGSHPELTMILKKLRSLLTKFGKLHKSITLSSENPVSTEEISSADYNDLAVALDNLGLVLNSLGELNDAKECLEIALAMKESIDDSKDTSVAITLNSLGTVSDNMDKLVEATECFKRALVIEESSYGKNNSKVAITLHNLGTVLEKMGKLVETTECYKRALVIEESIYGSNHPTVAVTLENLRLVLTKLEKCDEANDPEVAAAFRSLGLALKKRGQLDEAKKYFEKALAIQEEQPSHWHNLGVVLAEMMDYQKAKECLQKAIRINESIHGSNHPYIANSLEALAIVSERLGELDEAKDHFERALAIKERHYGSNHPKVAVTLDNLRLVLTKLEKCDEANRPKVAAAFRSLGLDLKKSGKLGEAKKYFEKALAIQEDEPSHWHNLGAVSIEMMDYQKGKEYFEEAIRINKSVHGNNHHYIANSLECLAVASSRLGKHDEAKDHYERALAIKESHYGSNHPMLVKSESLYRSNIIDK